MQAPEHGDFSHLPTTPPPPAWQPPLRFAAPTFPARQQPGPHTPEQLPGGTPTSPEEILEPVTEDEISGFTAREEAAGEEIEIQEWGSPHGLDDAQDGAHREYPGDAEEGSVREEDTEAGGGEILEALVEGFEGLKEELDAANAESRRNSKRVMEILRQFGQILDAVSGTVRHLHESGRQAQIEARTSAHSRGDSVTLSAPAFIEFLDRLKRIRDAADAPPPLPEKSWFAGAAILRALAPWKEERLRLRQSLVLIEEHAAQLLRNSGIESVPAKGQVFDPSCMIAVETVTDPAMPDHTVTAEILPGWRESATGKILRAAQVRVARKPATPRHS